MRWDEDKYDTTWCFLLGPSDFTLTHFRCQLRDPLRSPELPEGGRAKAGAARNPPDRPPKRELLAGRPGDGLAHEWCWRSTLITED